MITDLFNEQRPLMNAGIVMFFCAVLMAILSLIDPAEILGISRWIKPMKFFISTAIFLSTTAVYLYYLKGNDAFTRNIAWSLIVILSIEMAAVTGQSIRGTTSHFNSTTPFNSALFAAMGILIVLNTVLVVLVAYQYFRHDIELPVSIVWGMRLGLVVFLLGSIEGGYMAAQSGHTVGAADGGPGLPVTNWSTVGGDLRAAHFLGLHALQAIPLFAWAVERFRLSRPTLAVFAFALAYCALFTFLFVQALMGRPISKI